MLWAYREKRFAYVILGVPFFFGLCAFSLSSAVGFAAKNRGSISEDRGLANSRLAEVRKEIAVEEAKKTAFGAPRPVAVVDEAMRGLEQDRKWQWSKECRDATSESMRAFCKSYFELKGEAARSNELTVVEGKIERLKREARQYEEKGAGREADNQAAVIGRMIGLKPVEVEERLTVLLAVLVEIGAALGLYFATGHIHTGGSTPAAPEISFETIQLKEVPVVKTRRAPVKQLTGPGPRRVPRRSPKELVESNEASN